MKLFVNVDFCLADMLFKAFFQTSQTWTCYLLILLFLIFYRTSKSRSYWAKVDLPVFIVLSAWPLDRRLPSRWYGIRKNFASDKIILGI